MLKCGKNQPSVRLISIYRGENTWVFTAILYHIVGRVGWRDYLQLRKIQKQ